MKKKILLILILFIPLIVNAKEYCKVESGNLNTIGSEISCGKEHFYIIDSNDNEVKMLAKYNLYVGANYDKITLDINKTYIKVECINDNCNNSEEYYFEGEQVSNREEWESRIISKYNFSEIHEVNSDNGSHKSNGNIALYSFKESEIYSEGNKNYLNITYKLYPYTSITESTDGFGIQNELARGVTGEKGNANYPINATITLFGDYDEGTMYMPMSYYIKSYNKYKEGYLDFEFQDQVYIKRYLDGYKEKLNNNGYETSNVDMITIKEINDLVHKVSNKELPLINWFSQSIETEQVVDDGSEFYTLGDLKEFLSNDYSWLWNTSYWTKTMFGNTINMSDRAYDYYMAYFISSSGEICYSRSDCWSSIPRAGLRPTVTIAKENIKYNIRTKTDGNGTIEVIDRAAGGEVISFKVSAKKGLKLAGLTVTTDSQEKVQFNEEDLTTNKDGTVSISTNKFTMPYENVTIEARWATTINPLTVSSIFIFFLILIASVCIIFKIYTKKKEKNKGEVKL